jgi:hypothetical protein
MTKPQIAVRIPPSLLEALDRYVARTGASKTEVVVGALARYLGCELELPLTQKIVELEQRVAALEAELKT